MKSRDRAFLRAVVIMVGSVVGVGVFGLPYAFQKSGPALGALMLIFVAVAVCGMQLMYAEVALHTPGNHRLAGYVRAYLGEKWSRFALAALALALWGAMLAYMIVGGTFLRALFAPGWDGSERAFGLVLAALAGYAMSRGIRSLARVEVVAVGVLAFLFAFIILAAAPHAHASFLSGVHPRGALLSYGVALFALAGMGAVPEMKDALGRVHERQLPRAIVASMAGVALLYLAFGLTVAAVLGPNVTESAFDGLVPVLGESFRMVASLLGSLAILSIFSMMGAELLRTFQFDFHVKKWPALCLTLGVPCLFFLVGPHGFVGVLGFVGSVLGGTLGILVVTMYEKMRSGPVCVTHRCLNVPRILSLAVVAVFLAGIVLTVVQLFS